MEGMVFAVCVAMLLGVVTTLNKGRLVLAVQGDEDMKIASPGSFSRHSPEDSAEQAAEQFLQQKSSGNIDKARELGRQYAQILLEQPEVLFDHNDSEDRNHHILLLYSYVVNRVIAEQSPNSILAQTSLNVFYDTLENASPELYRHVSDTGAFSLYILCERTNSRSLEKIGGTYAALLNRAEDQETIIQGNVLYRKFYDFCSEKRRKVAYVQP